MKKIIVFALIIMLFIPLSKGQNSNANISSTLKGSGSLTDSRDGKVYKTIKIGTQTWMASNLNVEKFRNGDPILYAKTNQEWIESGKKKTPAWCYYDGNPENGVKCGKLYNIYALIDPRGLSPSGYRLPNDKDWDILVNAFGGIDVAGSKIRQSPENGGFSGILSGQREEYGEFKSLNNLASWWSSDTIIVIPPHMMNEPPVLFGRFRSVSKTNPKVIYETRLSPFPFAQEEDFKGKLGGCGLSVRCIKDDN